MFAHGRKYTVDSVTVLVLLFQTISNPLSTLGGCRPNATEKDLHDLIIELATDKTSYQVGDEILVTLTLTNVGSDSFMITSKPDLIKSTTGGQILIEMFNEKGEKLTGVESYGEFWGLHDEDLYSWIDRKRRLFQPGDFLGFSRSLDRLGFNIERPGLYRLRAAYWETDYKDWVDEKTLAETKRQLIFRLWSGTIQSKDLWIEVKP